MTSNRSSSVRYSSPSSPELARVEQFRRNSRGCRRGGGRARSCCSRAARRPCRGSARSRAEEHTSPLLHVLLHDRLGVLREISTGPGLRLERLEPRAEGRAVVPGLLLSRWTRRARTERRAGAIRASSTNISTVLAARERDHDPVVRREQAVLLHVFIARRRRRSPSAMPLLHARDPSILRHRGRTIPSTIACSDRPSLPEAYEIGLGSVHCKVKGRSSSGGAARRRQ